MQQLGTKALQICFLNNFVFSAEVTGVNLIRHTFVVGDKAYKHCGIKTTLNWLEGLHLHCHLIFFPVGLCSTLVNLTQTQ